MRKILILCVLASILLMSCNFIGELLSGEPDNIESFSSDDAEMNAAIQEAQETLPLFIEAFRSPSPSQTYFSVKAGFPYGEDDSSEYMWVDELTLFEDRFDGLLGNEPAYIGGLRYGDQVSVKLEEVADWMIIDDNVLLGGFTLHVIRNRMTEDERMQFDAELGVMLPDEPALP